MTPNKEKSIAMCGKRIALRRGASGIRQCYVIYCGYYNDCSFCKSRQTYKRRMAVERVLSDHDGELFRAVISQDQWESVRQKLNYNNVDYQKIPQEDGTQLLVTSASVPCDDVNFVEMGKREILDELTKEENLYAPGRRSSSRAWKYSQSKQEYTETMDIYELIPAFAPSQKSDGPITLNITNDLFLHAATWTKGNVTFDNLQEYANHVANKVIALALERGFRWDMALSKLVKTTVGREELDGWTRASVNAPFLTVEGDPELFEKNKQYLLEINQVEPHDYISEFREYISKENDKKEYGDLYYLFSTPETSDSDDMYIYDYDCEAPF